MSPMQPFPPRPSVDDDATGSNSPFASGHLWITERVVGDPLRFHLTDAGFLVFGDANGLFDHDSVPIRYRAAVRAVRDGFGRDAFAAAVDDPESVTFFGVATHARRCPYDLDRLPPFLGTAVHDTDRGRYLPPDTVRRAFEQVGLPTTEPTEKEVRAAHLDPVAYPIPDSQYYDGPAAGVFFHNKRGGGAIRWNQHVDIGTEAGLDGASQTSADDAGTHDAFDAPDQLLDATLTDRDLDRAVRATETSGSATVEAVVDRVLARLARETAVLADETVPPSESAVRSVLAERVDRHVRTTE
ncbi:MAG: hypothetical protein PPP55_10070 [Halorubrum sp.]